MAEQERILCASDQLVERGPGWRFEVEIGGRREPAFVVRYNGAPHAYLNRCAHVPIELDLLPGKLFDLTGHYLVCATHGAHYRADTGVCEMGPCRGAALRRLPVHERDGHIVFRAEELAKT